MHENPNTNVPMIRMSDVALTEVEWLCPSKTINARLKRCFRPGGQK